MKKGDIKKINICLDDQLMGGGPRLSGLKVSDGMCLRAVLGLGTLTDFNIAVPEPKDSDTTCIGSRGSAEDRIPTPVARNPGARQPETP